MAENSEISWTDHTFNPWIGCTKVGPGCDNCYAEARLDKRFHRVKWGSGQERIRTNTWGDPRAWNGRHDKFFAEHGRRQRVFCASLADVFDNEVDDLWRADLFELIDATPNLDWLLLTKRIGNARDMLPPGSHERRNLRIGATIVNPQEAARDINKLIRLPVANFLSMEPLLGAVDISPWLQYLDWVIVGGESGPRARPMHPDWARSLRDQCKAAGVPFHFKQWGEWSPGYAKHGNDLGYECIVGAKQQEWPEGHCAFRVGKKAAGRLLDGVTHDAFPEVA
jgi:protein gp37